MYGLSLRSADDAPEPNNGGSAFSSRTKRGAYLGKHRTPGAGDYSPNLAQQERTVPGGVSNFKAPRPPTLLDERMRSYWGGSSSSILALSAHVGPGTYHQEQNTMDSARRSQSARGLSSPFKATAVRECRRDWALPAEIEC